MVILSPMSPITWVYVRDTRAGDLVKLLLEINAEHLKTNARDDLHA